ncbi:MAG: hypothetical protein M3Q84_01110, partial [Actinomycetota bacterium]|nr:hypothetical protein [Actinomycetota bacterium]
VTWADIDKVAEAIAGKLSAGTEVLTELVEGEALIDVTTLAEAIVSAMTTTTPEDTPIEMPEVDLEAERLALELELIDD